MWIYDWVLVNGTWAKCCIATSKPAHKNISQALLMLFSHLPRHGVTWKALSLWMIAVAQRTLSPELHPVLCTIGICLRMLNGWQINLYFLKLLKYWSLLYPNHSNIFNNFHLRFSLINLRKQPCYLQVGKTQCCLLWVAHRSNPCPSGDHTYCHPPNGTLYLAFHRLIQYSPSLL